MPLLKSHTASSALNPVKSPVSTPAREELISGGGNGVPCQPPSQLRVQKWERSTTFFWCRWQSAGRLHSCQVCYASWKQCRVRNLWEILQNAKLTAGQCTGIFHENKKKKTKINRMNKGAYKSEQMIILTFPMKVFSAVHVPFCTVTV